MENKSIYYFLLPALLFLFSCKEDSQGNYDSGKVIGDLHISKEKPQPGDTLVMTYHWKTERDDKEPEAFFHYFVGPESYPKDIDLTESSGKWEGRIIVPDSATAFAINISRNGKVDHNFKKGFILQLYNKEGKLIPGSNASKGYFYHGLNTQYEVANDDSSLALIIKDLEEYPQLKKEWDRIYARLLNSFNEAEARKYIDERLEDYTKDTLHDEKELSNLVVFQNILKNKEKADSLQQIIVERFPLGKTAKRRYVNQFFQAFDLSKKEVLFGEYQNKFGKDDTSSDRDYMLSELANSFAKQDDWENFNRYSNKISDNFIKGTLYGNLANNMAEKDLDGAAKFSIKSLELLENIDTSNTHPYLTEKQYQRNLQYIRRMYADTYAQILYKQGNTKQALNYQKEAVGEGENSDYNERYLEYLITDEAFEKAVKEAGSFIADNSANARAKEYYKEAYIRVNGSSTDLKETMAQLEKQGYEKAKRNLQKQIVDEEAPDFRLADLDCNEIVLSSLKGKTVILDFWATWCKPCLDAFPGMQMALDKFKNDDEVVFLFVNTFEFEGGETLETKIRELLKKSNYSFQVVFDMDSEEGGKYKTAKDYNVSAIPTKIIIGPDGRLKYKKVGGSSNSEQVVQEFEIIIDLLNNGSESASQKPVS
jgi:thiol-disulfide isomerase/thioredoxin